MSAVGLHGRPPLVRVRGSFAPEEPGTHVGRRRAAAAARPASGAAAVTGAAWRGAEGVYRCPIASRSRSDAGAAARGDADEQQASAAMLEV
jgi:hypothetical protein